MTAGGSPCVVCKIVSGLVIIGAINWGLIGLFRLDLVAQLLGPMSGPSRAVYSLVGLAGLMSILALFKLCPCQKGACGTTPKNR